MFTPANNQKCISPGDQSHRLITGWFIKNKGHLSTNMEKSPWYSMWGESERRLQSDRSQCGIIYFFNQKPIKHYFCRYKTFLWPYLPHVPWTLRHHATEKPKLKTLPMKLPRVTVISFKPVLRNSNSQKAMTFCELRCNPGQKALIWWHWSGRQNLWGFLFLENLRLLGMKYLCM